jgi:predicted dehydrogenase
MDKIKLGVVGPGLIWKRSHQPVLDALTDRVEMAAFAASSNKRRDEVAEDYPGAPFYTDYHKLFEHEELDAIVVLTPIRYNAPVALAALEAGLDVIMEKPMGASLEEGRHIVRVAEETGRDVYVLEQAPYRPETDTLIELIESGEIGDLVLWERVQHHRTEPSGGFSSTEWRQEAQYPLGTLFDGGHHTIAHLSKVFGKPSGVYASGYHVRPAYGEYDQVLTVFAYGEEGEKQRRGVLSHASYMPRDSYYHIRGTEGTLIVERERVTVRHADGSERVVDVERPDPWGIMWPIYLDCLRDGGEPPYTMYDGLRDLTILDAIDRSAKTGQVVPVP